MKGNTLIMHSGLKVKMLGVKEEKVISAIDACNNPKSFDEEINEDGKAITLLDVTPSIETISKEQMLDLKEFAR